MGINNSTQPVRVLQIAGLSNTGITEVVMNYYRHIDTGRVQFDFVTESSKPQLYDDEVTSGGGYYL